MMEFTEPADEPMDLGADPVLQRALSQLRVTTDRHEAQLSLNIIKIIVEHQIEASEKFALRQAGGNTLIWQSWQHEQRYRHFCNLYDTLHSALQLLTDSPEDLQSQLIPSIAHMVDLSLNPPAVGEP
jgi:hypothetical protein